MMLAIPLAALLAAAAAPEPGGDASAAAVAPLLGEEVGVVIRVDLANWPAQESVQRLIGPLEDGRDRGASKIVGRWGESLKAAGAKDFFVLLDPTNLPGVPVALVPLPAGVDAKAVAAELTKAGPENPIHWPATEVIRGVLAAGTPEGLARLRDAEPGGRPDLAAALAEGRGAPVQLMLLPGAVQRRALEEAMGNLPPQVGGGPITAITRGLRWASLSLAVEPKPMLRGVVQAQDEAAAKALQAILRDGLALAARSGQGVPSPAELAKALGPAPRQQGDRVTVEVDPTTLIAALAGATQGSREATRRSQCVNNLKQFGLAMHNYHSAHNTFPAAFSASKDGKPLLSWRVQVLPFLDEQKLYDEFHLDEPWDSPHNKTLISRMPAVYACPSGDPALARAGKTTYLTPRGPATVFPGAEGVGIRAITDGTSNTIFVVDASDAAAVTWTKPEDWEVGPELKLDGLFGKHPKGTNVGFADGSVKFLKETTTPTLLRTILTKAGGEVVSADDQ